MAANLNTPKTQAKRVPKKPTGQARYLKPARQAAFLKHLAVHGCIAKAALDAGIDRSAVTRWRKEEPMFLELFNQAQEDAAEALEVEARRRAVEGVAKDVYHQGEVVGQETQYSDTLLALMLKARRPGFNITKTEISNTPGESFRVESSPVEDARRIAFALALGLRGTNTQEK
jgi:hypothetical protein